MLQILQNDPGYAGQFTTIIADAGTDSAPVSTGGMVLCGVFVPASFTGTAISFTASSAIDGTYVPVKSSTSGTALSYTVAASTYCALDPKDFAGILFLKIKSGSSESGAKTLICTLKGF